MAETKKETFNAYKNGYDNHREFETKDVIETTTPGVIEDSEDRDISDITDVTVEVPKEIDSEDKKVLEKKAFLLIQGKLDISKETPADKENILAIRQAILLGHPY